MDFLKELNDSQLQAVTYNDGPSLVIAGAGSGKTRVLTYKVAYLLSKGISPASILALTFTNKAANEMRKRIGQMVGSQTSRYLWMGTFHSIFSRILRNEAESVGYTKDFTIYDSSDSKSLIKSIIKDLGLDEKVYKPGFIQSRISFAKNNLITAQAYFNNPELHKSDSVARVPKTNEIYSLYSGRCKQANAMDFDDLLLQTNLLFHNHPDILAKYQNIFSYILVDEYQDTNFAQYLIIKKLAERHERICVVGDDAQSIYSFRGANIDNILKFQSTYKNAQIFKLEQNYRSTKTIVNAANSLIDKNSEQIRKTIFSEKEIGKPIKISGVITDFEEALRVATQVTALHNNNYQYKDIAILYRTNSQSRVMEESFRKQNIPYRIYGGLSFYQRKEIKDVIAYLRLVSNSNDEEALKRIINYPARGIGETTVSKIADCARLHEVSMWNVLTDMLKYNLPVNSGTANKLAQFRSMIDTFAQQVTTQNAYDLADSIVKTTGILADAMTDRTAENLSRIDNVQELLKAIHEFSEMKINEEGAEHVSLPEFLSEVSLLTDQDTDKDQDENKVTLMTIHAAKGLEFKTVFIVGLEEELFPSPFAETPRELEEERRLFYVAITRAEEQCFISYSKSRFKNGKTNFANPSRFLKDIDKQYLEYDEPENLIRKPAFPSWDDDVETERNRFRQTPFNRMERNDPPPATVHRNLKKISNTPDNIIPVINENLPAGTFVKHAIFGIGKVLSTSLVDGNEKAEIDFGEKGKKSLLLKFAKLEVLK
ncbi:MAG TPA: 3'-5' exonuclease [Paludibacteraceae bacterium]|nr:3'-5' exonuclease [Prolixibacteraceae bacterium]HPT43988.1 3'-5' exonuclease [Paludibacteraceae bacterium]